MTIIEINGVKGVFGHAYTGHAQRKQRKAMRAFILKNGGTEADFIKFSCEIKKGAQNGLLHYRSEF